MKHSIILTPPTVDTIPGVFKENAKLIFKFKGSGRLAKILQKSIEEILIREALPLRGGEDYTSGGGGIG